MRCQFVKIGERIYQCQVCGKTIATVPGIEPKWDKFPDCKGPKEPNMLQKITNYAKAVADWLAQGSPTRSDEEVKYIYENICKPCEYFDSQRETCKICGCHVRADGSGLLNKIRMATQSCPANPPKWTAKIQPST